MPLPFYPSTSLRSAPTALLTLVSLVATAFITSPLCAQDCPAAEPLDPPWPPTWTSNYHVETNWGGATYGANTYFYDNGSPLDRPFLFVEGIDFGLGDGASASQGESVTQLGDFGWAAFRGCDLENYPMMAHMPVLLDSLLARGYDPIMVDFADGTADIRANASVLRKILMLVHEYQQGVEPVVVSGASMGGQIARWALRQMEDDGEWPCAAAYVSLDSPHNGANIPLGLQQLIHGLAVLSEDAQPLNAALQSPATRQLLLHQLDGVPPERAAYQSALDSLGWPRHSYNIGIANGSHSPLPGSGTPFLDYNYSAITWTEGLEELTELFKLQIYQVPGNPNHEFAQPDAAVTSHFMLPCFDAQAPFNIFTGTMQGATMAETGHLDFCPGGTRPSAGQLVSKVNEMLEEQSSPGNLFATPHIEEGDYQPLHAFIPTTSALGADLNPGWTIPVPEGDTLASPFDVLHIAPLNQPHSEINPGNTAFLLEAIDRTHTPLPVEPIVDARNLLVDEGHAWRLRSAHCASGGRIGLNSGLPVYEQVATEPAELKLWPCGSGLLIEGTLDVGGGVVTDFHLLEGSSIQSIGGLIHVHSGSRLHMHSGSTLDLSSTAVKIDAGAAIVIDPNASVFLEGENIWSLQNEGQLVLNGRVQVDAGGSWRLSGDGNASFVSLTSSETGRISGTGEARWEHLSIHCTEGATLDVESEWNLLGVNGHGSTASVLRTSEKFITEDCAFTALNFLHRDALWKLQSNSFSGGHIEVNNGEMRWRDADLEGQPLFGHHLSLPCRFNDCIFRDGQAGVELSGEADYYFERCSFRALDFGLAIHDGAALLRCNRFEQLNESIRSRRGLLDMSPPDNGWNHFEMNGTHLLLDRAPLPLLAHGFNHFGLNSYGWAEGSVEMNTTCGQAVSWLIPGQSWGWNTGWGQIQTGLHVILPGCNVPTAVLAVDIAPVQGGPCRAGDRKNMREKWPDNLPLMASPNPVHGTHLTVRATGPNADKLRVGKVCVFDGIGRLVAQKSWAEGEALFDAGGWPSGFFTVVDRSSGASIQIVVE
ncbi:MAG: hypothetical protein P8M07_03670 [Flavobacteriales bacterium]|nr:hypothetical protein [Flavobacteriales bacterium]